MFLIKLGGNVYKKRAKWQMMIFDEARRWGERHVSLVCISDAYLYFYKLGVHILRRWGGGGELGTITVKLEGHFQITKENLIWGQPNFLFFFS